MGGEKVGFEAIVDVGPIALAIVENPAQAEVLDWLSRVLRGEIRCVIPTSTIMGAFIVATNYLRADPMDVASKLFKLVGVGDVLWFSDLSVERVKRSMEVARDYGIDSWDAYIITIMKDLGLGVVYTLDEGDFSKVAGIKVVNPVSRENFHKFQEWLRGNKRSSTI